MSRTTLPYMTKYEKAHILGLRAKQIDENSPIKVQANNQHDPLKLAIKELEENKIPIIIRRYLPDGSYEDWNANELIK